MRKAKIHEVVRNVAATQMKSMKWAFEFDELVNEGIIAVLSLKNRARLTEGLVAAVARRRMIQWKVYRANPTFIPMNSAYREYVKNGIATRVPVMEEHELGPYGLTGWRHAERIRDLGLALDKALADMTFIEKRLTQYLLNGGTTEELVTELKKRGFPNSAEKATRARKSVREKFIALGY